MIDIKNLNFSYKNKLIFNNFNLDIKDKNIVSLIGLNGSGKTTLVKILLGLLEFDGQITINDIVLNKDNIKEIRKYIGVVFENPDNQIVKETVYDDIAFILKNIEATDIDKKVKAIAEYLDIENILNEDISTLNINQKQLVCLAGALVHNPKLLILDEALSLIDPIIKDKILKLLKDLKKRGMTIINITHDIEDTLISDEIIVLNNGNVELQGKINKIYKEEKKLNKLGFKLPFIVELSNRLIFYGLINHVIYDMEEMVDILWK